MESEVTHSRPEPVDARHALALYLGLLERSEEVPFEQFCERFPQWKDELAALYRHWQQVSEVLGKWAGEESLSSRLVRRFGPESLRALSLEREATPAPEDVFEELFRKLRIKREGFGRYRVKDEVGHGGMGVVLRVWDDELKRHLAMKLIRGGEGSPRAAVADASTVGRFLDEAQVTAQLEHPGIVPVHELGIDSQGNLYFTMRLVRGRNLGEVFELVREGREEWNQTRALGVLLKACEALAYAHSKGVIHRDLKPSNIMVGRFGEVYVMDWGLAKVVGVEDRALAALDESAEREDIQSERRSAAGTPGSPLVTQGGHALGTPAYMSPEQARGEVAAMGPQSDVYSMGAILYHLLTGQMPYGQGGRELEAHQVLAKVLHGDPEPIQRLAPAPPPELVAICTKAMARRAEARYPTVIELANDLRAYLEHRVVGAYAAGSLHALRKWIERNKALSTSMAAAGVILIAAAFQYLRAEHLMVLANEERGARAVVDDHEKSRRLVVDADQAWPILPERIPVLEELLGRAIELVDGLDQHLARLNELRNRALPWSEEDRRYDLATFPAQEALRDLKTRRDRLRDVVASIEQNAPTHDESIDSTIAREPSRKSSILAGVKAMLTDAEREIERLSRQSEERRTWKYENPIDETSDLIITKLASVLQDWRTPKGLLADASTAGTGIPRRLALAQRMRDSLESLRVQEAWSEAIRSIADRSSNPEYRGLRIEPQVGLEPIGQDPFSGFWEFAHLATGEPPVRDQEGKLRIVADSAVVLVLLPGGRATLGAQKEDPGSPNYDPLAGINEGPVLEFELAPFFVSKYELTQGQWYRMTGEDPSWSSYLSAPGPYGSKLEKVTECNPVEHVSWLDCERALGRIGLLLPTEAQWEYAARGGTSTQFWGGEGLDALEGAANIADAYAKQETSLAWIYEEDFYDGFMVHCRVDADWPNPFGLHGVLGNLSEWCRDSYGAYDVAAMEPGTGMRPEWSKERVFRGGSFVNPSYFSRSAHRGQAFPDRRAQDLGVRPARKIDD